MEKIVKPLRNVLGTRIMRTAWKALVPVILVLSLAVLIQPDPGICATAPVYGSLQATEYRITASTAYETTPTLGNDGTRDLVVYTLRPVDAEGMFGPADIWYQPLNNDGGPDGYPVQVTSGLTDDQLNDISGDYIVYTAYDSATSIAGSIMLYKISTGDTQQIGRADDIIQEPKIYGTTVVWREGGASSAMVRRYRLAWLGSEIEADVLAGPVPTTFTVEIGSRYVVWSEMENGQYDVYAYDLDDELEIRVTNTSDLNEQRPSTYGPWVVWQERVIGTIASKVKAKNLVTGEFITISDNDAEINNNPSIDGDLVVWESAELDASQNPSGYLHIYAYLLSTGETFQVTTEASDQYLCDVFGWNVAYVDARRGSEDVYVSHLSFVNNPPVLEPIGNKSINEGEELTFTLSAADADGDPLTYSVSGLPTGANFNPNTGAFDWTPTYSQAASFPVVFSVTDGKDTASESITITVGDVNRPPVLNPIVNQNVNEGQTLNFTVSATDLDEDPLVYSVGDLPDGASFAADGSFSWSPTFEQAGNYTVVFTVREDREIEPQMVSESVTITVGDVNRPPELAVMPIQNIYEGQMLRFTVTATDPDKNDTLTFTADSASYPLPDGATFDSSHTFTWTPRYDQAGTYDVEFAVTDSGNPPEVDVQLVRISVGNIDREPVFTIIGPQTVEPNYPLEFYVSATDPDGDAFTYGAADLPAGASFDSATQSFYWIPTPEQAGNYVVTFSATDSSWLSGLLQVPITVSNGPSLVDLSEDIVNKVLEMDLTKDVENSYIANIKKVAAFVTQGRVTPAVNQLQAFIKKVQDDMAKEKIKAEDGNQLIPLAQDLIAKMQG